MPLSIDPDGNGFAIRLLDASGLEVARLPVTGADVLVLAQSAQMLRASVLASFQPKGLAHGAVFSTPVERMILAETSLGEALLLTLIGPNGSETTYTLEPADARLLADRLTAKLADLGKPGANPQ